MNLKSLRFDYLANIVSDQYIYIYGLYKASKQIFTNNMEKLQK